MAVTTNTRKLAALLGASGAGIGTDGLMQPAGIDADMASQAELDAIETEADKTQTNLAILAFKSAVNGSLAKYNLQDQIVDEFVNATGVDAGASSNATLTSGVYSSSTTVTPTVTHDADATGTDGDYTWYKWTDTAATGSGTLTVAGTTTLTGNTTHNGNVIMATTKKVQQKGAFMQSSTHQVMVLGG